MKTPICSLILTYIADSIHPLFEMLNRMAPSLNIGPVTWEEFDRLRDLSPRQILKELKIPST